MRQVFTLWPTESQEVPQRRLAEDGFPAWSRDAGPPAIRVRWMRQDWLFLTLATAPVVALAVLISDNLTVASMSICVLVVGLTAFAIASYRTRVSALQEELARAQRWNDTLFQRSGISLWREDWSVARDEVKRLLENGVIDMQSYFAIHPDELRAIRSDVIIKDVNDFAVLRAGVESKQKLLGSLDNLLPDTDHTFVQWLIAFAQGDSFYRSETHITMPGGKEVSTLFSAGLPRNMRDFEDILVSDLDITEYKETQARLARAEKDLVRAARISTMGELTASIAHEVNSPLAAIVSSSEAALRWLSRETPDLPEAKRAIGNALAAAMRAKIVVEHTRAFLSNAPTTDSKQDVVSMVRDSVLLIERELRTHGVSIQIDAPDGLPPVLADAVNIQQVMVNLMMNAAQAMMGQAQTRDLTISVRGDGDKITVAVRDRGPGIPTANLSTIFQPFYSSREGGMGMGLAICKTCIEAHGGRIWASSPAEGGTIVQFELPIANV